MEARKSKDPRGGAGLLFLAGLALQGIVGLVALRTLPADAQAALRDFAETTLEMAKEPPPTDTGAAVVPTTPPVPVTAGDASLSAVAGSLDAWVEGTRPICYDNLASPEDADALIAFELTVEPDGRVSAARVAGASLLLKACLEAEALSWTVPAPSQKLTLVRSVRFEAY